MFDAIRVYHLKRNRFRTPGCPENRALTFNLTRIFLSKQEGKVPTRIIKL